MSHEAVDSMHLDTRLYSPSRVIVRFADRSALKNHEVRSKEKSYMNPAGLFGSWEVTRSRINCEILYNAIDQPVREALHKF
jgi:hypothetical protein